MRVVLREFFHSKIGNRFYLAGGTALSLQLGHRRSVDLDLFSPTEDIPSIRASLEESLSALKPELSDASWGNLVFIANNVRVGFFGYGYALLNPLVRDENLRLASIEDIAMMKMDALLSRANRKDFYDLYFISQKVPLKSLLDLAPKKYPSVRDFEVQVTKRLVYFESAEHDPDPILLQPVSWDAVKNYFAEQARQIEQSWLK
ncbi:MAG TPA: nucleotidyl transferase AbiEii/AbiGii toxin family protein [Anaerolineales bacterium]|nr:nucleotidyl transferase AbiEii/AbiGii toxin family protein [Anaerolineales bacterium]